jgi:hypothetical protein
MLSDAHWQLYSIDIVSSVSGITSYHRRMYNNYPIPKFRPGPGVDLLKQFLSKLTHSFAN